MLQECVPEALTLKQKVFAEMDAVADSRTILASSTSSMPASMFAADLKHRAQVIVAHPVSQWGCGAPLTDSPVY